MKVPKDHPVRPIRIGSTLYQLAIVHDVLKTCPVCYRSWDSRAWSKSEGCPFKDYHA